MKGQNIMEYDQRLGGEAESFIAECYRELGKSAEETQRRQAEVRQAIAAHGYYAHTAEELAHGAKMAWRNSNRCIGRLFWETLHVFDARAAADEEAVAEALLRHIAWATNGGKIRPAITVFAPAVHNGPRLRVWNHQLIRYAGYERAGHVIGDSASLAFTNFCRRLGWAGEGTPFDVLPLVVQVGERRPRLFSIPQQLVLEVPIRHPEWPGIADLGLKWYGVPFVSDMRLEIGGLKYTAAPFNGWYMGTEIGARNLADTDRYNMLPRVAEAMGLETSREFTLWQDKALVELNVAVLQSYREQGVTIVDHHTAAQQFKRFETNEAENGRAATGDWTWLIPPLSPATTHIFHKPYKNEINTPNFFRQKQVYPEV